MSYSPLRQSVITQTPVTECYNSIFQILHDGIALLSWLAVNTTDHSGLLMKNAVYKYIYIPKLSYGVFGAS